VIGRTLEELAQGHLISGVLSGMILSYTQRKMTDTERAQTIWEAFCGELTQEPTDDMKEAFATAIKELVSQLQYDNCDWQAPEDWKIMDARDVLDIADELEAL